MQHSSSCESQLATWSLEQQSHVLNWWQPYVLRPNYERISAPRSSLNYNISHHYIDKSILYQFLSQVNFSVNCVVIISPLAIMASWLHPWRLFSIHHTAPFLLPRFLLVSTQFARSKVHELQIGWLVLSDTAPKYDQGDAVTKRLHRRNSTKFCKIFARQ